MFGDEEDLFDESEDEHPANEEDLPLSRSSVESQEFSAGRDSAEATIIPTTQRIPAIPAPLRPREEYPR